MTRGPRTSEVNIYHHAGPGDQSQAIPMAADVGRGSQDSTEPADPDARGPRPRLKVALAGGKVFSRQRSPLWGEGKYSRPVRGGGKLFAAGENFIQEFGSDQIENIIWDPVACDFSTA